MMRGMRAQSSRTVLRPSVMTSGRARSCTNASTSCRSTAAIASGGTSSWHACAQQSASLLGFYVITTGSRCLPIFHGSRLGRLPDNCNCSRVAQILQINCPDGGVVLQVNSTAVKLAFGTTK